MSPPVPSFPQACLPAPSPRLPRTMPSPSSRQPSRSTPSTMSLAPRSTPGGASGHRPPGRATPARASSSASSIRASTISHEDFLDADGKSRILAIWDQSRTSGQAPVGDRRHLRHRVRRRIRSPTAPARIVDVEGHGTHVAGIAAGRDENYGGVAPDANIVVVQLRLAPEPRHRLRRSDLLHQDLRGGLLRLQQGREAGHAGGHQLEPRHAPRRARRHLALRAVPGRARSRERGGPRDRGRGGQRGLHRDAAYTGIHTGFECGDDHVGHQLRDPQRSPATASITSTSGATRKPASLQVGLAIHNGTPNGQRWSSRRWCFRRQASRARSWAARSAT